MMQLHPQQQLIRDLVADYGDDPVRVTTIVNEFAKVLGYTDRKERDQRRLLGFAAVGQLVKACLLERHGSHKVRWVPLDNRRRKNLERRWEESLNRLPHPNLA